MKRYLIYIAIIALGMTAFMNPPLEQRAGATASQTSKTIAVKPTLKPAEAPQTPKATPTQSETLPQPTAPAFDANNPATWPKCQAGQIVRADNGQCDTPATPVATAAAPTRTYVAASYSGDHNTLLAQAGIAESDWQYADYIVGHEGHYDPCVINGGAVDCSYAANGGQRAYGVCQALPGNKMASAGDDWATNPVTQLRWCASYAASRYGSWANAYYYWVNNRVW